MAGEFPRRGKQGGSYQWQVCQPWMMVEDGRDEGPWGSMISVKSLGVPLFSGSPTVVALDFNQGFRNLIEAVQGVQGVVGSRPPQRAAGGRQRQQSLSPAIQMKIPPPQSDDPPFRGGTPRLDEITSFIQWPPKSTCFL